MTKIFNKPMNIFKILWNGILLYLKNFLPLQETMLFPVFGQILGILLILVPVYYYSQNVKLMVQSFPLLNNIPLIFTILILITLPGFFLFVKAFWDYMIKMISLNLMVDDIVNTKALKSHKLYSQIIRLRSKDYIVLLSVLAIIWLIGLLLPVSIFATGIEQTIKPFLFVALESLVTLLLSILSVYLSLTFQVFAFENQLSPMATIKRSFELVSNNFWRTLLLAILLAIITCSIIPGIFQTILEGFSLSLVLSVPFEAYLNSILPDPKVAHDVLAPMVTAIGGDSSNPIASLSVDMALSTVSTIITAFILPLGTTCYALLYRDILTRKQIAAKAKNKSVKK